MVNLTIKNGWTDKMFNNRIKNRRADSMVQVGLKLGSRTEGPIGGCLMLRPRIEGLIG